MILRLRTGLVCVRVRKSLGEDLSESRSSDTPARVFALRVQCARGGRGKSSDGQLYHAYLKGHSVTVGLHFTEPACGHREAN